MKAGFPSYSHRPVQVSSFHNLHALAFLSKKIELSLFYLVIIYYSHHNRSMMYQQVVDGFPNAIIIGLTATPCLFYFLGLFKIFY